MNTIHMMAKPMKTSKLHYPVIHFLYVVKVDNLPAYVQ